MRARQREGMQFVDYVVRKQKDAIAPTGSPIYVQVRLSPQ